MSTWRRDVSDLTAKRVSVKKKIEYKDCIERCSNSIKRVTGEMSVYMREISNAPKEKREKEILAGGNAG